MPRSRKFAARDLSALLLPVLFLSLAAAAEPRLHAELWARATAPGAPAAAIYGSLHNVGDMPLDLSGFATTVAGHVSVHETFRRSDGNLTGMRPLAETRLAPGERLTLEPGGNHIMLMGLTAPLVEGETVPLSLDVGSGAPMRWMVPVRGLGAVPEAGGHGHH